MAVGIPSEAVGASIGVLFYSVISLFLCLMLVGLLISFGERYTYVTIHSTFTALSTVASIIQQIHYAARWRVIKEAQYQKALRAVTEPGLTFVGGAHIVDKSLFLVQFWCYNTMALNIFFWSVALFTSAWGFRTPWLGDWLPRIGPMSKVFSIIFPGLIIGLMQAGPVLRSATTTFIVENGTMLITLISGSILVILILYKYMKTRRLAAGGSRRGRWWASQGSKSQGSRDIGSHYTPGTGSVSTRSSIYDRALITRFSIGFIVLFFFLATIIVFSYVASTTNSSIVAAGKPNFSTSNAKLDILLFMPGVTASLVTFLVFGTAKSWRQYRDFLIGGCGIRNKIIQRRFIRQTDHSNESGLRGDSGALEFAPLPELQTSASLEERTKQEEAMKRVRMFAREVSAETRATTTTTTGEQVRSSGALSPSGRTTSTNPAWDAQSLAGSTTAADTNLTAEYNSSYPVPLAVRSAPHQIVDGTLNQERSTQFHRPRPSLSQTRVGSNRIPTSAHSVTEVDPHQNGGQVIQTESPRRHNGARYHPPSNNTKIDTNTDRSRRSRRDSSLARGVGP